MMKNIAFWNNLALYKIYKQRTVTAPPPLEWPLTIWAVATGSLPATAIDGIGEVEFVRLLVVVSCEIWISLVTETEPVQLFAVLRLIPPWGPPPWVLPPFEELSKLLQLLVVLACCNPTVTDGMFLLFVVVMVSTMVLALLLLLGLEVESPLESWSWTWSRTALWSCLLRLLEADDWTVGGVGPTKKWA